MSNPAFEFIQKKASLADDADPSMVAPSADRIFDIPVFAPNGEYTSNLKLRAQFFEQAGYRVPTDGTFDVSLYLNISGGGWVLVNSAFTDLPDDATISLPFGSLGYANAVQGTFRIQNATSTTGTCMKFTCTTAEPAVNPRTSLDKPQVAADVTPAPGAVWDVQPVPGSTWDVSDRAARLLGVVYGSVKSLQQGAAIALADALAVAPADLSLWDVKDRAARLLGIIYGTEGQMKQKAASTAAAFTDTAVVTDIRPGGVMPAAAAISEADAVPTATTIGAVARGLNAARTGLSVLQTGYTSFTTTVLGWLNVIPTVLYNASPTVRTEGQYSPPQGDLYGNAKVAEAWAPNYEDNTNSVATTALRYLANGTYSPGLLVQDFGATVTKNGKASAGVLTQAIGKNRNITTRWLQIHNTATTPAGGAVPAISIEFNPGEQKTLGPETFSVNGFKCATGIAYAWSSTSGTYTAATAADHDTQLFGV